MSQCLRRSLPFRGGPRTAEAPALEAEGCLLQNTFAERTSSQPGGLSLTFQEAGPSPALCPGHPVLMLIILNSLLNSSRVDLKYISAGLGSAVGIAQHRCSGSVYGMDGWMSE